MSPSRTSDRALGLVDRGLGVNLRRIFQIRFRPARSRRELLPFACADSGDALFRRSEIARDEQIETVGEALVVDERIPVCVLQLLEIEDFVVDVVLEDAHIDLFGPVSLRQVAKLFELFAEMLWRPRVPSLAFRPSNRSAGRRSDDRPARWRTPGCAWSSPSM